MEAHVLLYVHVLKVLEGAGVRLWPELLGLGSAECDALLRSFAEVSTVTISNDIPFDYVGSHTPTLLK